MTPAVLVTGGSGYVGSHVCKRLAAEGFLPVTLDNLERGNAWAVRWGPLYQGQISNADLVAQVVRTHQPVATIHMAAYAYVEESVREPLRYWRNNVVESLALLEALNACGGPRAFIFSSTCAVFGTPSKLPITEAEPPSPINPYGATKLAVESALDGLREPFGLSVAVLRYFNAAGADPDGEIGECHDPEPHVIPRLLRVAAGQAPEFKVFGDNFSTPDGTCVRDYVHVSDLAEAHVAAMQRVLAGKRQLLCHLGTTSGSSILDLIGATEAATGRAIPYRVEGRRAGDPAILVADSNRAAETLGWRPRYSLTDQLRHAWAWQARMNEQS